MEETQEEEEAMVVLVCVESYCIIECIAKKKEELYIFRKGQSTVGRLYSFGKQDVTYP